MEFIGNYWFLWLIGVILFIGVAITNQVRKILRHDSRNSDNILNGFGFTVTLLVLGYISMGLLVISIILNIITYAKM